MSKIVCKQFQLYQYCNNFIIAILYCATIINYCITIIIYRATLFVYCAITYRTSLFIILL